jgi:integrase
VEAWLDRLCGANGKLLAPGTRSKIRNMMSALFSHGIRHQWVITNPITGVRTSAKRQRQPEILTPEEFTALVGTLKRRERVMVLIAGSTGLRRGELIALRWQDIDFVNLQADVTRSIWRNRVGETKRRPARSPSRFIRRCFEN